MQESERRLLRSLIDQLTAELVSKKFHTKRKCTLQIFDSLELVENFQFNHNKLFYIVIGDL